MLNRQHLKSSLSEIVDKQVVMYVIYLPTSLCVDKFTLLQFSVKSAGLMRLFAVDLTYSLVI